MKSYKLKGNKDPKIEILNKALLMEVLASEFLASLLNINIATSKTLGNSSESFSFDQKIKLLIDIDAIPKDSKEKFRTFMMIRNQFMHNIEANNYTNCINFLDGKDKYLLKLYPSEISSPKEEQLKKAVHELTNEIFKIFESIQIKLWEKREKEVQHQSWEAIRLSLDHLHIMADQLLEQELKQYGKRIKEDNKFGIKLEGKFLNKWREYFKVVTAKNIIPYTRITIEKKKSG
jgi:hypothetical protein